MNINFRVGATTHTIKEMSCESSCKDPSPCSDYKIAILPAIINSPITPTISEETPTRFILYQGMHDHTITRPMSRLEEKQTKV
jgi:hypothetical protein